jgi:hypothetical protein
MALADFIPVLLFGAAAVLLQRDLYSKMVKGAYALFAAGTINVFMAGFLKALYKLLYALEVCDFQPLTQMFFPLQALGFLMAGCGALYIGTKKAKGEKAFAVAALPVYKGTFVFVSLMVAGLGMMDFGLVRTAKKMRQHLACTLFIVSFVFSLGMGYLSSKDFSQSYMNWVTELVNIIGQASFFAAALILHKAGLAETEL